jgi:hypothetical protein
MREVVVQFVNWQAVHSVYCGLMWFLALVLTLVILLNGVPQGAPPAHHAVPAPVR